MEFLRRWLRRIFWRSRFLKDTKERRWLLVREERRQRED